MHLHDLAWASAYAYSISSLCYIIVIIMVETYTITTFISILQAAKWLLKVICFAKICFLKFNKWTFISIYEITLFLINRNSWDNADDINRPVA